MTAAAQYGGVLILVEGCLSTVSQAERSMNSVRRDMGNTYLCAYIIE